MRKKFEIEPGIIISKLNIKDSDTLIVTVDADMWDIEAVQHITDLLHRKFPNNNIICELKGLDITVKKNAGAGSSPE